MDNLTLKHVPLLVRKISEKVIGKFCQAFGVENLQALVVKLTSSNNDIPAQVSSHIDGLLRNQAFVKSLAEAFASNEEACSKLGYALNQCRKKKMDEAAIRRHENLTAAVISFYNDREPEADVKNDTVSQLVERLDDEGVVRNLSPTSYLNKVTRVIPEREDQMALAITDLCKVKTNDELISTNAKLLVMEGLPLGDPAVIRQRLESEDDIAPRLKKA